MHRHSCEGRNPVKYRVARRATLYYRTYHVFGNVTPLWPWYFPFLSM